MLRAVLVYVVGVEILLQGAFGRIDVPGVELAWLEVGTRATPIPRGVFLEGAVIGTLYAFVAMGLILVHRSHRIINFAQAQLGAVPAVVALLLMAKQGVPYLVAVPVALVGGALLGAGTEVVFIRRFRNSSRLILTVVTIGVGFVLLVLEVLAKLWVSGDLLVIDRFPTPFSDLTFSLGISTFFGDHLVTLLVAVVVIVGLGAFFRRSDIGIAVRAAAENRDLASLLGVPVSRVSTIVWALAGVLSAIGVFLRAPLVGLPLTGFVGPTFLLFGLAAAVLARMEKLPTALVAGIALGMVDNTAVFLTRRSSLALAALLVVIVGALLLQRREHRRTGETSSWQAVRTVRAIPARLRGLTEVVWGRRAVVVTVALLALATPWIVGASRVGFATLAVIYAMVGISLVILTGWAGQISLGQFGLAGIGAAVAGGLAANHGWDFFLTLLVAGIVGALIAVVIGLPALRIQGLYLAVTTLAFAFTVEGFVLRRDYFPWLLPDGLGLANRPVLYGRLDLNGPTEILGITLTEDAKFYFLALIFLALAYSAARALRRYRSGRVLIGLRDNERLLQAYGVSPARSRLAAFGISGFIAAVAGALLAYEQGAVDAATYAPELSIQLFVMTVIGGIGSLRGAVLGAVFIVGVPQLPGLRGVEEITLLSSGLGVLAILYFLPGGLAEGVDRIRDGLLRRVAERRGIEVPSLVADRRVDAQDDDTAEALAGAASRLPKGPAAGGGSSRSTAGTSSAGPTSVAAVEGGEA